MIKDYESRQILYLSCFSRISLCCLCNYRVYISGKGRHPKFYDPESHKSYPIKSHGKKTLILSYALDDLIDKFDLPGDIFN